MFVRKTETEMLKIDGYNKKINKKEVFKHL